MFEARCEQVPKEVAVEGEVEEQASLLHGHHAHAGAITQDGGLLVLQEVLHAEDGGPGLSLDVLEQRAPSGVVDLLVELDFTDWNCPSSYSPAGAPRRQQW